MNSKVKRELSYRTESVVGGKGGLCHGGERILSLAATLLSL